MQDVWPACPACLFELQFYSMMVMARYVSSMFYRASFKPITRCLFLLAARTMIEVSLTPAVCINGGALSEEEQWYVVPIVVDGASFVRLSHTDRKLAAFCGFDKSDRSPLKHVSVLDKLVDLRNAVVDEAMRATGDVGNKPKSVIKDDIDSVLTITMPKFSFEGMDVDELDMKVLASATRNAVVAIELNETNLNYIYKSMRLAHVGEDSPKKRGGPKPKDERCTFESCPSVRRVQRGSATTLYVTYTDSDGRKRRRFFTPKKSDVEERNMQNVAETAEMAQKMIDHYVQHQSWPAEEA